jgi:hypothetical protein
MDEPRLITASKQGPENFTKARSAIGLYVTYEVTPADIGADSVEMLVTSPGGSATERLTPVSVPFQEEHLCGAIGEFIKVVARKEITVRRNLATTTGFLPRGESTRLAEYFPHIEKHLIDGNKVKMG